MKRLAAATSPGLTRSRLATTLVLSHVLVIAVATLITTLGLLSLAERYFVDADRESLALQARVLARTCDASCVVSRSLPSEALGAALPAASQVLQTNARNAAPLQQMSQQGGTVVAPLTSDARVVAVADGAGDRAVLARALEGQHSTERRGSTMRAAAPILIDGAVVGAIEVEASLNDAQRVVSDLRWRSLAAALVAMAAAALLAVLRARTITRPLAALREAASAIAEGDYDRPVPAAKGNGEMAELTASFAMMRERVQSEMTTRAAFVADASHELRTPLAALRGYVELLAGGAAEKPDVRARFLAAMAVETQRMIRLTDDLVLLSRGDASALDLQLERTEWQGLVQDAAEPFFLQGRERSVDVTVEQSDPPCDVDVDRDRMRQVVANLLDNAARHAAAHVVVSPWCTAEEVGVDVGDDGPGIGPAERERVFERFARLDAARARDGSGNAGLGLAIVASLVHAHGGTVTALDGPAGGALLRVTIPRHPSTAT